MTVRENRPAALTESVRPATPTELVRPTATYRLQLHAQFGFADVVKILPTLDALGISHLYLSPIATAMAGSTHGYDWIPPASVAEDLGGIDGLRALRRAARKRGMGIIVDIVPNHMGIGDPLQNAWWTDVLRHGRESDYAHYFDLDLSIDNGVGGKIALPVLESGDDDPSLIIDDDGNLVYRGRRFPTAPGSVDDTADARAVHDSQHYRLVPHDAGVIGYRRFFAVNELAALRQEDPDVYDATHRWIFDLVAADLIDGVRVDHPDGLADPVEYLQQLRVDLGPAPAIYVEKVLAHTEELDGWLPVNGTTGYDQLRIIDALFVSEAGMVELTELHEMVTGSTGDAQWLHDAGIELKKVALTHQFSAEFARLVRVITETASEHGVPAGIPPETVAVATSELIGSSLLYREDYPSLLPYFASSLASLATYRPELAGAVTVIADATTTPGEPSARLGQVTGAVTAKSIEDCLFYRTARLVSTQEVGCDPGFPTLTLAEFHELNERRVTTWPLAMSTSSTHDTKRGEDVRTRIRMLSQIPQRWMGTVLDINRRNPPPDPVTGLFLLQNIFGIWPADGVLAPDWRERVGAFARKAVREAGVNTSWTDVNDEFEEAVEGWIDAATTGKSAAALTALATEIDGYWQSESLAHKAITLLSPGVPDIYQGTQWWEDSLVDPDNRRDVDYTRSLDHPKAKLISTALRLRRNHSDAFDSAASYLPLFAEGPGADRIIAFGRGVHPIEDPEVIVVTTRFTHSFSDDVRAATTISLPDGEWVDAQDKSRWSGDVSIAALLRDYPVALLEHRRGRSRRR